MSCEVKFTNYRVDLPYPDMNGIEPNLEYGKIILEDYAGRVSELSAITQYIYHHFRLDDPYPDVAEVLRNIAIVEMSHLDIVGTLILKLGVDPQYYTLANQKQKYWTAKPPNINYAKSLCKILKVDIDAEKEAIRQYRETIRLIDDRQIDRIIERIILDEELHIKILKTILCECC